MTRSPLAVVTMVHNEPDFLPVWAAHYAREVGRKHCHVIDHGSTEGLELLATLPHVHRLPRSVFDDAWRCKEVAAYCNHLLGSYEHVAYTDVDELLLADPRWYANLLELCEAGPPEVLTGFGMDVVQIRSEKPIDLSRPVTAQRHYVRPFSSLCKPNLIRRPIVWEPGFHYGNASSQFCGLYLFHIAYADFGLAERRQAKRVGVKRPAEAISHHSIPPAELVEHIRRDYASLPRRDEDTLGGTAETAFMKQLLDAGQPAYDFRVIGGPMQTAELWRIPPWFQGRF